MTEVSCACFFFVGDDDPVLIVIRGKRVSYGECVRISHEEKLIPFARLIIRAKASELVVRIEEVVARARNAALLEQREVISDLAHTSVILDYVFICTCERPVDHIDLGRSVVAVLVAALRASHLLSRKDKRCALRQVEKRARKLVLSYELIISLIVAVGKPLRHTELIPQCPVIVTRCVGYDLSSEINIVFLSAAHTRCELVYVALGISLDPAPLRRISDIALHGVSDAVVEKADPCVEIDVIPESCGINGSARAGLRSVCAVCCRPAFAPYRYARVYAVKRRSELIECFSVMESHQVEAEAVDMILIDPVETRLDQEFSEHLSLGRCVVAAARSARVSAVFVHSVVVLRNSIAEAGFLRRCRMVINNVHNDRYARIVKSLYHLLALGDTNISVIRI